MTFGRNIRFFETQCIIRICVSVVLQLGTLYQPFKTYLHHHPVSAAISKPNYSAGRMALIHHNTLLVMA